jgi:hypothetical protein
MTTDPGPEAPNPSSPTTAPDGPASACQSSGDPASTITRGTAAGRRTFSEPADRKRSRQGTYTTLAPT